jgi:phage terminase large subunit-like protein
MTLQQWVEHGWLRVEPSSANEIRDLFSVVMRSLKDAKVEAISDDLRFQAAFSAALNAANIALRASGYRTRVQTGHHQKIVESLELTIQADAKVIRKLLLFSKKRNATSYDAAGSVSQQERQQMIKVAVELHNTVTAWLQRHHAELLKS